ncbi:MAG: PDZ domain-containing protein [Deltaproteobacteria bacterium]|nr:PDZ domain-containing protein [Deltaproteobacteria bacterium]
MKKRTVSLASIVIVTVAITLAAVVVLFKDSQTGLDRRPEPGKDVLDRALNIDSDEVQALSTMYRTITLVQQHYLDASRIVPRKMLLEAMKELELDLAMLIARENGNRLDVKIGKAEKSFRLDDLKNTWHLLSRFKDIFTFIKKNNTDENVDFVELQYTAINGMLKALDPHTVLLTPDVYRSMKDRTHGNFGGLGIVISIRDGSLTIISPIDGTPADRAGLKSGDVITKIGEASTINMPINDAVDLMRGKPGTSVTLYVQRKGWATEKAFRIKRAIIKVRSVDSAMMPGKVGYVRIHDFQANTASDLMTHLEELSLNGGMKGLVLDLRSNPGGLLSAAIDVSDIFLSEGVIVTTAGQKLSERKVEKALNSGKEPSYPIVILVNSGTASASEIVAGALKGHNRAVIIGERTFGKGSVQVLNEFPDNSALKLTTAQYLTPGDVSIQSVGIVPNIELIKTRADKQRIHLRQSIRYREGDLSHSFENTSGRRQAQAEVQLKYLYTPELKADADETEEGAEEDTEEETEDITEQSTYNFKFEPDFEINLAKDVALRLHEMKKQGFDTEALGVVFDRLKKDQQSRLASALRKMGIDWTNGPSGDARILATANIVHPDKLIAGEDNELTVTVTNTGTSAVYQLLATTRSDFMPLDHQELAFGKLTPGQTIVRTLPFKIPQTYPTRTDDVKVTLSDATEKPLYTVATRFSTEELPAPVFAFSTAFMDDVSGNSDGLLQTGEIIRLVATIKNAGTGKAMSTYASLTNDSGNDIFLKKGRQALEELAPGETKEAIFEFEVKKGFSQNDVRLKLSVMDVKLRVFTTQALKFPILPALDVTANNGLVRANTDTSIWTTPQTDATNARIMGTVPAGAIVKTLGTANGYQRIAISDTVFGWVMSADVTTVDTGEIHPLAVFVNEPPKVRVAIDKQVVRTESIVVKGTAKDDQLVKDLYIFNNKNKTFFALNEGKELSFDAKIPLELGLNYITVVAEETADLETRQTFIVRRDKKDGMPYIASDTIDGTPEPLGVMPTAVTIPQQVPSQTAPQAPTEVAQ